MPATHLVAVMGEGIESAEEIAGFIHRISSPVPAPTAPSDLEPSVPAPPTSKTNEQRVKASPLARRLAQEKGMDLATVQGTGPDGRIEKDDVLRAASPQANGARRHKQ